MRIRTGYSFRVAVGHLTEVAARLTEIGSTRAPISDRCSTFGFTRWTKLCREKGLVPVYGAEIAVVPQIGEKKQTIDYWTFFATENLRALNDLVRDATATQGREPSLSYKMALERTDLIKFSGERVLLENVPAKTPKNFFVGLSPAVPKMVVAEARRRRLPLIATSDNLYPTVADAEFYKVTVGKMATTQTYPQHILSDREWSDAVAWLASPEERKSALANRDAALALCRATLSRAELLTPEKPKTLRAMCVDGAKSTGTNLRDPVYAARLDRELAMIAEKKFEDYFYILADMIGWAKERMIVGPARGSSCGSLVCFLLGITSVDPIPHKLIFERFIDITRADLPDVDIDFSDAKRHLVFEYAEKKYGKDHVARLGTVGTFQPKSALNQVAISLRIPSWRMEKVTAGIIQRAQGDNRASQTIEDTLTTTEVGRALAAEFPEVSIVARLEDHPSNPGQHAAGVVITKLPVAEYVAVDARTNSIMADKKDAEALNLLKIDALGLTQLSIFERTLELIGEKPVSGWLERLPLDDQRAFDVLNRGHFSGIFQFMGQSVQGLTKRIKVDKLEDLVAITALARPGPLGGGGAEEWSRRRIGTSPVTYPHEAFEPYLRDSLGVVVYQEQVLSIGRELGDLTWEEVTKLRQAMSKSLGKEFFNRFGDKWKANAVKRGIPRELLEQIWDDLCLDEDTLIRLPAQGKKPLTIGELYKKYEAEPSDENRRKGRKPALISLFPDGRGRTQRSVRIIKSGRKVCWRYVFNDGSHVVCTPGHRFIVNGDWKKIGEARVGDAFLSITDDYTTRGMRKLGKTGTGKEGRGAAPAWSVGKATTAKRLVKKTRAGMRNVYDISMKRHPNFALQNGLIAHNCNFGAWAFNRSHSVAYGYVSYWCCWLKAYHPVEFAAATLDAESDPAKQITMLRELRDEGINYVPVDPQKSGARWEITERGKGRHKKKILVGPLTAIKGIGPAGVADILRSRAEGTIIKPSLEKKLLAAKTEIDSLYPISDATQRHFAEARRIVAEFATKETPTEEERATYEHARRVDLIVTDPMPIAEISDDTHGEVMVIAMADKIQMLNENELVRIQKRNGRRVYGPENSLNLFVSDDTGRMFCKVHRRDYDRVAADIVARGRAGKVIYALKGTIFSDAEFRMLWVNSARFIGEL